MQCTNTGVQRELAPPTSLHAYNELDDDVCPLLPSAHTPLFSNIHELRSVIEWRKVKKTMQNVIHHTISRTTRSGTNTDKRLVDCTGPQQTVHEKRDTHNTMPCACLRQETHAIVQEGTIELVGRSNSGWAGDSPTRHSITGFRSNLPGVMLRKRNLKQTAINLSSFEAVFLCCQCVRSKTFGSR